MKHADLTAMGYPQDCIGDCMATLSKGFQERAYPSNNRAIERFREVINNLEANVDDPLFGPLVQRILTSKAQEKLDEAVWANNPIRKDTNPIPYARWGKNIEQGALDQMKMVCELPVAVSAAVMPDAHLGYGLPIGGVVATYDSVIPFCVGVDIACRMKVTFTDIPVKLLENVFENDISGMENALQEGTVFGMGGSTGKKAQHAVLDMDWNVTAITREMKDRAWEQLGTSGSGNHFCEFGIIELREPLNGLNKGRYVALLSHSGSRGTGAKVCATYTSIAQKKLPKRYERFKDLAWLPMSSEAGQEYWAAMNLMGEYASANHAVIHEKVIRLAGGKPLATIENHHNFAWIEEHNGQKVYVHRKGATPAGKGVYGVIPGSMATSCFLVKGKGEPNSLLSASHGAGRAMSRTKARDSFTWKAWNSFLKDRGVKLLSAGLDEVPGAYKDIHQVMAEQSDLVEVIGEFMPKIVKMSDDGKNED